MKLALPFVGFGIFLIGFLLGFEFQDKPKEAPPCIKIDVETWESPPKVVGHLYLTRWDKKWYPQFVSPGSETKYGGEIAWHSVAGAVNGKQPFLELKVVP